MWAYMQMFKPVSTRASKVSHLSHLSVQASAGEGDPLRGGVPDSLIESSLQAAGALEVGQAAGKRLFALELTGGRTDRVGISHL